MRWIARFGACRTISHAPPPLGRGPMNATVAIVRYRLGEQDGEPVVRVAILCERGQDECESLRGFIMKGLPFARPRR